MTRREPSIGSIALDDFNSYASPKAELLETPSILLTPKLLEFSGRLSLTRFWLLHLIFCAIIPDILLVGLYMGLRHEIYVFIGAGLAVLIPVLFIQLSLLMRRARDLNFAAGWGVAALFVPVLGNLIWLVLCALPGKTQSNRFGPPNKPDSIWTKLLVIALFIGIGGAGALFALSFSDQLADLKQSITSAAFLE